MTITADADRVGPTPGGVVSAVRHRWWVVVLCLALVPGLALLISAQQPKRYTATAALLFQPTSVVRDVLGTSGPPVVVDPARDAATHLRQVASPDVAARTARVLGEGTTDVSRQVKVAAAGETSIVTVDATTGTPQSAAQLANLYARQFVALQRDTVREQALAAQAAIRKRLADLPATDRNGALGGSLRDRSLRLGVLAAASPADVTLTERATPPASASSPKTKRDIAFGIVLGLLAGIGLALLAERLSTGVRDPAEVERLFDAPVLAELPESDAFRHRLLSLELLPEPAREALRMLRARLQDLDGRRSIDSVLFTSCRSGDGKSMIAGQFAASAAVLGVKTVLVEADLRGPTLAADAGLRETPGLADALDGDVSIDDVTQYVDLSEFSERRRARLAAIVAGAPTFAAPELIESPRMSDVLGHLVSEYELVVLDTPSPLEVSDAIPLIGQVDCVLVVVRMGATSRKAARSLSDLLTETNAPVLGTVANRVKGRSRHAYGYARRSGPGRASSRRHRRDKPGARAGHGSSEAGEHELDVR
jgi:Mrp family chromosome partitioning ATPase